ncbi:LacI family DNA-binding transcriptional regulator, partial [Mycobacterium tuberculosis]|nr:LacI family DNA-binding transcriptional regulator [Mycobacterium tuberculosis]
MKDVARIAGVSTSTV